MVFIGKVSYSFYLWHWPFLVFAFFQYGVEISLTALHAFAGEEALNELSHLAAQYSDVNCTPDDIRLYLDRIARGMPVASKAASMTNEELSSYFQSMREKKQGLVCEEE